MLDRSGQDFLEATDRDDVDVDFDESVEEVYLDEGEMTRLEEGNNPAGAILTGGDIDANTEQAATVGDEAVGGTVMTPDRDGVDDIGAAVGLEMPDREWLHTDEILTDRDDRRWELDPKSSEDYERRRD